MVGGSPGRAGALGAAAVLVAATLCPVPGAENAFGAEVHPDLQTVPDRRLEAGGRAVVRRRRRKPVSREMRELGRTQGEEFLGLALGAAVGVLAASVLSALWRRSPRAARTLACVGLAAATMVLLGLWHVGGRVSPAIVGSGISWLLLAATLVLAFRPRSALRKRESLAWLRVPSSHGSKAGRRRARPAAAGERPAVDEALVQADAMVDRALEALEAGDVDSALEGLRRSIGVRPTKRAHTFLATALGARGEDEAALAELDRALALDSAYAEALDEKARILEAAGRAEEAAEVRAERSRGARAPRRPVNDVVPTGPHRVAEGGGGGPLLRAGAAALPDLSRSLKDKGRVARAKSPVAVAAWGPAAAFSGAVVAGALLSIAYAAARERVAAYRLASLLDHAEAGLSAEDGEEAPPASELERRRLDTIRRNVFTRDRAASLKVALALYAYGRAEELRESEGAGGRDGQVSRWVAAWARRRIAEARAVLEAGDRTRLPAGLAKSFAERREDFERELERRLYRARAGAKGGRRAATAHALKTGPQGSGAAVQDWRTIWKRPPPGTSFLVEAFTRTGFAETGARAPVGNHADGSPVAAAGLLRFTVAPVSPLSPPEKADGGGEDAGPFVLLIESLPFGVEGAEPLAHGIPPAVRLVLGEGERIAGPFRLELGPRLEFRSLASLAEGADGPEELLVSRDDLYAAREIPLKSLPIFAPGLGPGWLERESYFRPYGDAGVRTIDPAARRGLRPPGSETSHPQGARGGGGPAVKQVTHWKVVDGVAKMRIGWRTRYRPETKEYTEQVVQAWTPGRAWWDFYDDGVLFFRTVFPSEGEATEEGVEQ